MELIYQYDSDSRVTTYTCPYGPDQAEYEARRAVERDRERAGRPHIPYEPYVVTYVYTTEGIKVEE